MAKAVRSKKKPPKHKPLSKKPDPNSNTKQRKWIAKAIDWMKEGWSSKMIKDAIYAQKVGGMARPTIDKIVYEASRLVIQDYAQDRATVTAVHVKRYNRQIKRLLETRDDDVIDPETGEADIEAGRKKKIDAYFHCLDTMFQKEKLLQYHNKSFKIVLNNIEEIEILDTAKKDNKIDVSKLSFEERLELFKLMQKAKRTEDEVLGVKLNDKVDEQTIDVEHEEVKETNVDKIKETNVEKVTGKGITLADAALKLKRALQREAVEKIQKAGGKINPDELH